MFRKALLVFSLLIALTFVFPSDTYAFDFFGLQRVVNELVHGPKQEEESQNIFQRFFGWVGGIWKKGDVSLKSTPAPTAVNNPFPPKPSESPKAEPEVKEQQLTPQDEGKPVKSNATGKWVGRWTVTSPDACKGESGEWSANLVDSGGKLSGTFTTPVGGGNISGTTGNWSVGGGGGEISFKGSVSGNTISGNFTGEVCDPDEAPENTKGTFFGGKIIQ